MKNMYIVGLRRLTIAPLLSDAETLLEYGAPIKLARTAIGVMREAHAKGGEYFDTSGERVRAFGGVRGEMTIRFSEANETALALILGARIDENGVFVSGGGRDAPTLPLAGPSLPYFALGYEAFAVDGGSAGEDEEPMASEAEEASSIRADAFEKTWLYKCAARLGRYERARAGDAPKAAETQLIITTLATRRRYAGAPLTAAYLPADAESAASGAWFDRVYLPEDEKWTS